MKFNSTIIIVEGKNDLIFLESIFLKYYPKYKFKSYYDTNVKTSIKKITMTLRVKSNYEWIINNKVTLIYGNHGKDTIRKYVLPYLFYNMLNKSIPYNLNIYLILDNDNQISDDNLLDIMIKNTKEKIMKIFASYDKIKEKNIQGLIVRAKNILRLHLLSIPISLEYRIACKLAKNAVNKDPHNIIRKYSNRLNISTEELLKKSIYD